MGRFSPNTDPIAQLEQQRLREEIAARCSDAGYLAQLAREQFRFPSDNSTATLIFLLPDRAIDLTKMDDVPSPSSPLLTGGDARNVRRIAATIAEQLDPRFLDSKIGR